MSVTLLLVASVICLALSAFHAGAETGMYCLNRLRLRLDAERGDARAKRLTQIIEHEQSALSTLLVGTNVANYFVTIFAAIVVSHVWQIEGGKSELITTAIVTPIVFVFGEVVPKIMFQREADTLMRRGAGAFHVSSMLLRIPVTLLNALSRPVLLLVAPHGRREAADPRRRMALLLQNALASDEGGLGHLEYIDRVLDLSNVALHEVMVPRNRIASVRADTNRKQCIALARRVPHSRFPVFDKSDRRIEGYVLIDELLADENWTQLRGRLRPIQRLKPHDSVAAAIVRLQSARENLAIVEDRRGNLLGLVTLKDLLEELTGELHAW